MTIPAPPYTFTLFVGEMCIQLMERSLQGDRRDFSVALDHREIGRISLLPHVRPSIAVHYPTVILWGGVQLFYFDVGSPALVEVDLYDELLAIYALKTGWCLVGETSITTMPQFGGAHSDRYLHDEVIVRSWLKGSALRIEDFQGRLFKLDLAQGLVPHQEAPAIS